MFNCGQRGTEMWERKRNKWEDRQMKSQKNGWLWGAGNLKLEVWRTRWMKSVMNGRSGWINKRKLGPPLQVLWYQRSCYQQRLLPFGADSPVWQRSYHDNHQSHTSGDIITDSTLRHHSDIVMLVTTAQGKGLLHVTSFIFLSPSLSLADCLSCTITSTQRQDHCCRQ